MNSNLKSQISPSAIINSNCRIIGNNVSIGHNCEIGEEGIVVIENCQLGNNVKLKSGFFKDSVFLDNSSMGSNSYVRGGTLLEEFASGAHCVGFKETILFPYAKTGSLINFCDALLSGGTDLKNHSEIGSSYVHFNYTINKDKATPSLFGNVIDGIFLDQNPIFLGGQGGAVGPINVAFGSKITAGSILRKDYLKSNQIISEPHIKEYEKDYIPNFRSNLEKIIENNFNYIGSIAALRAWYKYVRSLYIKDIFHESLIKGAEQLLLNSFKERIKQINTITDTKYTIDFPKIDPISNKFINNLKVTDDYINDIKNISPSVKEMGKIWIKKIIDDIKKIYRG